MMIIHRYLIKEVSGALLAVTLVLLLIFLSNQLIRYLSYAASGKIAANLILQLLGFEIPHLLALLLPLGLYLGIILAFGRMYADSEMSVLHGSGFSIQQLVFLTLPVAVITFILVACLSTWLNPLIAGKKIAAFAQNNIVSTLQPGRFQVLEDGKFVIYIEGLTRDRKLANNLFIAKEYPNKNENSRWDVVAASFAHQAKDQDSKEKLIVSTNGYRYEGTPGQNDYKIVQFQSYAIKIPADAINPVNFEQEAVPTKILWEKSRQSAFNSELQWRISMPLTVFVLTILAIPLCRVAPRKGRYPNLVIAILIYVIYINLLVVSRNWIEQKFITHVIGLWWVHGLFLTLGIMALIMQQFDFSWKRLFS